MAQPQFLCIDLKSFYASVECVDRGLDPLTTDLVVADPDRTERTICLAVSPSLKAKGIKNRCRIYEIPENTLFITAKPRMSLYIEYSARIYGIYLSFLSKDDIHIYSIDEAFLDVTNYLPYYHMTARTLATKIMSKILAQTGITATCGIGTNLYLAKIALDIVAKHAKPDKNGARIGVLDEETYCKTLWDHLPITDFWRIGHGTERRLGRYGLHTMGQVAHADEDLLYRTFGVDAELLIDHAWGRESVTMADIKAFQPQSSSLSSGQVLHRGYTKAEARLIVREMADSLSLDLVEQGLVTSSITLQLGYSFQLGTPPASGTVATGGATSSTKKIMEYTTGLYDRIAKSNDLVHRVTLCFNQIEPEIAQQYDMFSAPEKQDKERRMQAAIISIKQKYGKNAIVRAMDLQEAATTMDRNEQIGGHHA